MIKYNPIGIYVSDDGKIYLDEKGLNEIIPSEDSRGYLFYESNKSKTKIQSKNGNMTTGYYLHRIVVFTFGDCNGNLYNSNGLKSDIDHIDMNHKNNSVSNLEIVTHGINLLRGWWKTGSIEMKKLLDDYYNKLFGIERVMFDKSLDDERKAHPDWY